MALHSSCKSAIACAVLAAPLELLTYNRRWLAGTGQALCSEIDVVTLAGV
jgi:hypothetical protein